MTGRVLPVNGWGLEGTFAGFERPIRQARSIASAQRRTHAADALPHGAMRHGDDAIHRAPQTEVVWVEVGEWIVRRKPAAAKACVSSFSSRLSIGGAFETGRDAFAGLDALMRAGWNYGTVASSPAAVSAMW